LRSKRRPNEREAWSTANATVVMIRGEKLSAEDMSRLLLAAHAQDRLDNYIAKRTPPMILYLNPDGQLQTHLGGERRGGRKKLERPVRGETRTRLVSTTSTSE
jgi:hypothetical protein